MHSVLVLGGYGFFGKRICATLAREPAIKLYIAGRDRDQAAAFAAELDLPSAQAIGIDAHSAAFAGRLRELSVDTLIHTAGPFQGQNYVVAKAAIEARCNYIDLADGRTFVVGIASLDEAARERGVTVISGASSVPALSSAVVDRHLPAFRRLDTLRIGIASGARTPGLATMKGIFSYCGKPFARLEQGAWRTAYGWLDLHRHRFPMPIGARWMGSCEVPDLDLFPRQYPSLQTVTFHAGFASGVGHLLVWGLSGLVKLGLIRSIVPMAVPLNRISHWIEPIVSDKGAMFVHMQGIGSDGQPLRKTWNLLAARNHGPHIPCGASIALARKLARGEPLRKGAMPCTGLLGVEEYLAPLCDLDIREVEG
ncbi:saccharopine dehydrogenase family protein [Rudaea sp.]|uniref:saccharopine dehydrogenase family protein n=1 Tax=Rudaea sp. TaxID=2136325 RepID=UPI002ED50561